MKKIIVLFLMAGLWVSCNVDSSQTIRYRVNEPVFTSSETFRRSIRITSQAHPLKNPGKICFYKDYFYISEPGKGIHIIDNTRPSFPQNKGYIEIPGHQESFVRGNILYANALVDLIWFDLSDPLQPVLQGRAENLFPEALPPIENEYGYDYQLCREGIAQNKIITGWQLEEHNQQNYYSNNADYPHSSPTLSQGNSSNRNDRQNPFQSRLGLYEHYLYTVINHQMNIIDLSGEMPQKAPDKIYIGDVETVFPCGNRLFMGMTAGLAIYSLADPARPTFCSQIAHIYSCNPIAVDHDRVYVSIYSGNLCGQNVNQLKLFDVSDIKHPVETASQAMTHPKGLSIDNKGLLFLCDTGLKVFKIGNSPTSVADLLAYYPKIEGANLLFFNDQMILISDKGLYQYDCSDPGDIRLLSVIPISN